MNEPSGKKVLRAIEQHVMRAMQATDYNVAQRELSAALEKAQGLDASHRFSMEVSIWIQYAAIAEHAGDLVRAIENNEKLALARPDNATPHLALARLFAKVGNAQRAAESLERCRSLAEESKDSEILATLAKRRPGKK